MSVCYCNCLNDTLDSEKIKSNEKTIYLNILNIDNEMNKKQTKVPHNFEESIGSNFNLENNIFINK